MANARKGNYPGQSKVKLLLKVCLLTAFIISGCSTSQKSSDSSKIEINLSQDLGTALPYRIEVIEEINDGAILYVKTKVTTLTDFMDPRSLVKINGLKNGIISQEKSYLLKEHLHPETQELLLDIPSNEITDYQIELLWGKEAETYLSKINTEKLKEISLQSVQVEKVKICENETCHFNYKISGSLQNDSKSQINEVVLGLSFQPEAAFVDNSFNYNDEKNVPVKNLNLAPEGTRTFNLQADGPSEDLEAKPYLRILSGSFAN